MINSALKQPGGKLIHGAQEDAFAPGYYSVLFEDPDSDGVPIETLSAPD